MRINRELWRTGYIQVSGKGSSKEDNKKRIGEATEGGMRRMHSSASWTAEGFKRKEEAKRENHESGNRRQ